MASDTDYAQRTCERLYSADLESSVKGKYAGRGTEMHSSCRWGKAIVIS